MASTTQTRATATVEVPCSSSKIRCGFRSGSSRGALVIHRVAMATLPVRAYAVHTLYRGACICCVCPMPWCVLMPHCREPHWWSTQWAMRRRRLFLSGERSHLYRATRDGRDLRRRSSASVSATSSADTPAPAAASNTPGVPVLLPGNRLRERHRGRISTVWLRSTSVGVCTILLCARAERMPHSLPFGICPRCSI